ncbi:hypothetical protein ACWEQ7_12970, partial [Streptomyces sp. NPDC004069]
MSNPPTASAAQPNPATSGQRRPRTLLAMHTDLTDRLFDRTTLNRLTALADLDPALVVDDFDDPRATAALRETEVIVSSWGCPPLGGGGRAPAPARRRGGPPPPRGAHPPPPTQHQNRE